MITYTTLMGVAAGLALILITRLGYKLVYRREAVRSFEGWALAFAGLGSILTLLSAHMTLTWPLQAPERFKNFMFGELNLAFGVLLLLAAFFLWLRGEKLLVLMTAGAAKANEARAYILSVIRPVSWIVFGLGLALTACTVAALQYKVFATAPPQEPLVGTMPKDLVNLSLSMLYALPAIGALLTPLAVYKRNRSVMATVGIAFFVTGIGWLVVGALVYYTHIAMDFNFRAG